MDPQLSNGRISFLWNQMEEQINRNGSKEFKTRDESSIEMRVLEHFFNA